MKYVICNSIAWQEEKTEGFIYIRDLKRAKYYYFDGISREIWLFIVAGYTENMIIDTLVEKYSIDSDTLIIDVKEFLDELLDSEIIRIIN